MKQLFLGILMLAFLSGCGYKPVSYYAKHALGQKIYAEVTISRQDPTNSVLIKDAVNEAIVSRFGAKLVSKEEAESILHIKIGSIAFSPTVYDKYGYVVAYVSDNNRFDAIRYAANDALDEFVSKIAIKGLRNGNNN